MAIELRWKEKRTVTLPMKFPLLLAQGAEELLLVATKILPHNFRELCEAAVKYLRG